MTTRLGRVARGSIHVLIHLTHTAIDAGDAAFAFMVARDWLLANLASPQVIAAHGFEAIKLAVACTAAVCTLRAAIRSVAGLCRIVFERKEDRIHHH